LDWNLICMPRCLFRFCRSRIRARPGNTLGGLEAIENLQPKLVVIGFKCRCQYCALEAHASTTARPTHRHLELVRDTLLAARVHDTVTWKLATLTCGMPSWLACGRSPPLTWIAACH
jgi:hypothetical protein